MPISKDEAVRLARAYSLSLVDAEALMRMSDTFEEAQHLAIQFGGTDNERSDEAYTIARKAREADQAVENKAFEAYQAANPKPLVAAWKKVEADLRPGMSDVDQARAISEANAANARGEAEARSAAAQQKSADFYAWKLTLPAVPLIDARPPGQ